MPSVMSCSVLNGPKTPSYRKIKSEKSEEETFSKFSTPAMGRAWRTLSAADHLRCSMFVLARKRGLHAIVGTHDGAKRRDDDVFVSTSSVANHGPAAHGDVSHRASSSTGCRRVLGVVD